MSRLLAFMAGLTFMSLAMGSTWASPTDPLQIALAVMAVLLFWLSGKFEADRRGW